MMMRKLIILMLLLGFGIGAKAQIETPVKWSYAAKMINGTEAVIYLKATIEDGWHIYSAYQADGGPLKTSIVFDPSKDYVKVGKIIEPKPIVKFEKVFDIDVNYFEKSVVFLQKIKLKAKDVTVKGSVEFMVCNEHKCLPPETVEFSIPVK